MAQDVQFGGNKDNVNKESETSLRLEGVNEDDVENRFNLGGFAGQVRLCFKVHFYLGQIKFHIDTGIKSSFQYIHDL